ncbi:histidine kinase-like ATPase, partial [Suillus ampliporus]
AVEVNQRGLVDKVLTHYPGEFTVFRELLQNVDDAGAKNFAIAFRTPHECASDGMKPDLNSAKVVLTFSSDKVIKWVVKNDGAPFEGPDWKRLMKIAEGNPDEQKIGAFGVSFFSVFSVTDKPVVKSNGTQWYHFFMTRIRHVIAEMNLHVKKEEINRDNCTVIKLELKEESTIPRIFELAQFLVTSITFLAHIQCVMISLDDTELSRLTKNWNKTSQSMDIPQHMTRSTPGKTMTISSVELICRYFLHLSKSAKL